MEPIQIGALLGVIGTAIFGGVAWLVRRKFTDDPAKERTALYLSLADLSAKLKSSGLSVGDVKALEAALFEAPISAETAAAVSGENTGGPGGNEHDRVLPDSYWSTKSVKARAGARLAVLDNQIEEALVDFSSLIPEERAALLHSAHQAWIKYRGAEASFIRSEFKEGTFAPLAGILVAIRLSEEYLERLSSELAGAKQRLAN